MENADLERVLGPMCDCKVSRDVASGCPIVTNLVSKYVQDLKENSHEKAHRNMQRSQDNRRFCTGCGQIDPPPPLPVKIGLIIVRTTNTCFRPGLTRLLV